MLRPFGVIHNARGDYIGVMRYLERLLKLEVVLGDGDCLERRDCILPFAIAFRAGVFVVLAKRLRER